MRFLLILILIISNTANAQLSKKHWIPPIHTRGGENLVKDHYVYLSTPEATPFQVTVKRGDGSNILGSPFTISSGNPARITIGNTQPSVMFVSRSDVNIVKSDNGLILEGPKEFYATFKARADNHAEILVATGYQGIGNQFRLGSLPQNQDGTVRNFFASFMATEDNTTVTISDYDTGVEFVTAGANDTSDSKTFTMNEGETVTVSGYTDVPANLSGFVGALVTSTKPIAVNTGNAFAGMSTPDDGQDFTFDQIVPVQEVGKEYVVVRGNGSDNVERPLIIATENNTQIYINGSAIPFTTLNSGEYTLIPSSMYQGVNNQNMYIASSKPVYLYQIIGGDISDATSGLNFIPPLSCFFQKTVDLVPSIDRIGNTSYNSEIIALTYAGSTLKINGNLVSAIPEPVLGNPLWVTYKLSGYTGNAKVESTGPLAVGLFGFSFVAGFAGYYSGFGSEPSDTNAVVCSNTTTDLLDEIDGNPDPGGVWSPPLASGTGVFDPNIDLPGVYNYNFTGLCQIVNVKVTVSVQQGPNPGINNVKTVCKNDPTFDLFVLLGPTANSGGTWSPPLASRTSIFNPAIDLEGIYTYTIPGDAVCEPISSTVTVTVNPLPLINTITDYNNCDDNSDGSDSNGMANFDFSTKTTEILAGQTGINVTYHLTSNDATAGINPQTLLNTNNRTIYVRLTNSTTGCFITTSFNLVVNALPVLNNGISFKQCDDNQDAITSFNLTEINTLITTDATVQLTYFTSNGDALANTSPITNTTNFTTGGRTIWVRATNAKGCTRVVPVLLIVSATQISGTFHESLKECDEYISSTDPENDGYDYFNFTATTTNILATFTSSNDLNVTYYVSMNDALAEENPITDTTNFRNTIPYFQTIYVRVDSNSNNDCVGLGPYLDLKVNTIPKVNLGNDFPLCLDPVTGTGSQIINATPANAGSFTYDWTPANPALDGSGNQSALYNITQAGTYSVVVTDTNNNCENSDTITIVTSSEPVSVTAVLITPLLTSAPATIQATALGGYGVYEYSINGINWQSSGIFSGLSSGSYVVSVRDVQHCGLITSNTVHTVMYPNFFTPNGDGYNDTWKIDHLLPSYEAKIYIFDRFGKLIKEINPNGNGWDGTFNGNPLPATDYWFKLEYTIDGKKEEFKNHFALKR